MSHLLAPQEEKKDARVSQSEPVITDTSFLVPPQEEKSAHSAKNVSGQSWMVPPQEEKIDTAALRGEKCASSQRIFSFTWSDIKMFQHV